MRNAVDHHGAGSAFGAIAAELGAGEPQLVAQGHRQGFLWQHLDAAQLTVHVDRDQPLDRTGNHAPARRAAGHTQHHETCGRSHGPGGDDALDELAAGNATRFQPCIESQIAHVAPRIRPEEAYTVMKHQSKRRETGWPKIAGP